MTEPSAMPRRYHPLWALVLARIREFLREPEAIFWVYIFPILLTLALGIAFSSKPITEINLVIAAGAGDEELQSRLQAHPAPRFRVRILEAQQARELLRVGKTDLVVVPPASPGGGLTYCFDPARAESMLARYAANEVLQGGAALAVQEVHLTERGSRYIDFLIPGLLGLSLMGGGMWGVGFVTVEMRIRMLLKRLLATPMKKRDFLLGIILSRLVFTIPEVLLMLLFSWLVFGVEIRGSVISLAVIIILGAFTFSGIGLLVASRAKTIEAVSGLMNLVMLPMWLLSGIFFASERFPEALQPLIRLLPLTPLITALRATMLDGTPLWALWPQLLLLVVYGLLSFGIALRIFRWQ
jgi:ABC-2 type transport system permease protein